MTDRKASAGGADRIRSAVRAAYAARIAGYATDGDGVIPGKAEDPSSDRGRECCCGRGHTGPERKDYCAEAHEREGHASCCGGGGEVGGERHAARHDEGGCCCTDVRTSHASTLGYSRDELASLPEGADVRFGCGNPGALAGLQPGETVLDLGSGGGLDCLLAAQRVGPSGHVIGVDMTAEMIERARIGARSGGYSNVEFRLGEIEHLPVADASVDVIISNCVINLSPDKPSVFAEAFRVLRRGGRLIASDVVSTAPLPDEARADAGLWCDCVSGAEEVGVMASLLRGAGFEDVQITPNEGTRAMAEPRPSGDRRSLPVLSATIEAWKPQ